MKKFINLFIASFLLCITAHAQVLFHEDFEASPVTSIVNNGEAQLTEGPSPCGKASRGNAGTFYSASVDFQSAQNSGYFLAVNPQSPCGGYYVAQLHSGTVNLSSADSLVFSCRYFISNTLMWGAPVLQVNIKNGPANHVIWSEFTTVGNWTSMAVGVPSTQIGANDTILITIGGGEGVGIDDITITNIPATGIFEKKESSLLVFPNPASNKINIQSLYFKPEKFSIINSLGENVMLHNVKISDNFSIDLSSFPSGFYTLIATGVNGNTIQKKILKN